MKRSAVVLVLFVLAVPLLASGCGGDEEAPSPAATATPSPTAVAGLPEGFPADFPLWEKGTIAAAGETPDAVQGRRYVLGVESIESSAAARAFYESALAQEPWQVDNLLEIPASEVVPASPGPSPAVSPEPSVPVETIIIEFSRRDGSQMGTVAIQEQQTNGRQTTIAVSLVVLR